MEHARRHVLAALILAGALGLFGAVLASGVVRCPTALLLGVPCPACGTTRAARALLAGDLGGAMRMQPVAPLVLLVLGTLAVRSVWLVGRRGHAREVLEGTVGRVLVSLIVVSTVAELVVWGLRWFGMFGGPVPV